jgi:hypothetical protein
MNQNTMKTDIPFIEHILDSVDAIEKFMEGETTSLKIECYRVQLLEKLKLSVKR